MKKIYKNISKYMITHEELKNKIIFISKYFPYITFIAYPFMIIYTYIYMNTQLLLVIVKPLSAFILVTVIRDVINRPRPFETLHIKPLVKHKNGKSFPSRHAVSAIIIALTCLNINIYLGIILLIIGFMICLSRILVGVHYISDVLVSILIAFIIHII